MIFLLDLDRLLERMISGSAAKAIFEDLWISAAGYWLSGLSKEELRKVIGILSGVLTTAYYITLLGKNISVSVGYRKKYLKPLFSF